MIAQLSMYKNMIAYGAIVLAVIGLWIYVDGLKSRIDKLEKSKAKCERNYMAEQLVTERFKAAVSKQNARISEMKLDVDAADKRLAAFKAKPAEIRYKYKEVYSNECKDIKSVIDDIRHNL